MPGTIQVSEATHALRGGTHELEARGGVDVKGKGAMRTFFVRARKAEVRTAAA